MNEGDPLEPNDHWLRNINFPNHIRRDDGRASLGFFRINRAAAGRAWDHEVSGRAKSECGADVHEEGRAAEKLHRDRKQDQNLSVSPEFGYLGYAHAVASALRGQIAQGIQADVIYTPTGNDAAHSDFAVTGSTDDDQDEIKHYLQDRVKIERDTNFKLTASTVRTLIRPR